MSGPFDINGIGFNPTFFSGVLTVPSGSSLPGGVLFTLTPPDNRTKVRLLGLTSSATESGVTVTSGSTSVVTNLRLAPSPAGTVGDFAIGQIAGGSSAVGMVGSLPFVESDTEIKLIKVSGGATTSTLYYSYAYAPK